MRAFPSLTLVALLAVSPAYAQEPTALVREFTKVLTDWGTAAQKKDSGFFQTLMAEEYVTTGPDGAVANKAEDIAAMLSDTTKIESFVVSDVEVRVYGEVAIVTGVSTGKWAEANGTPHLARQLQG